MSDPGICTHSDAVKEPADRPFVSLTEAITWISHGIALDQDTFGSMRASATGIFDDVDPSDEKVRNAIKQFSDRAGGGVIKVRGRYVADHACLDGWAHADTADISANILRDYALFDIGNGGLRRGSGLSVDKCYQSFDQTFDRITARHEDEAYRPDDGYLGVEVRREDLMREFPDPPASALVTYADAVSWCWDWQKSNPGNGMDAAWRDFRVISRFRGMSRDDVLRPAFKEAANKRLGAISG